MMTDYKYGMLLKPNMESTRKLKLGNQATLFTPPPLVDFSCGNHDRGRLRSCYAGWRTSTSRTGDNRTA